MAGVVLVPPFSGLARHAEWAEALQYSVLALPVPALVVAAGPWRRLGLARAASVLNERRQRHRDRYRVALWLALGIACLVLWRTPVAVDQVGRHGWALAAQALTLLVTGCALWLECLGSPPVVPRCGRPWRIAVCAVSMWSVWVMAYLLAMSHANWYGAYAHIAGHGLSLEADQQVAAGTLWAAASACFIPVIFWNLFQWLRAEEDPDEEMHRLVREERRRGMPQRRRSY